MRFGKALKRARRSSAEQPGFDVLVLNRGGHVPQTKRFCIVEEVFVETVQAQDLKVSARFLSGKRIRA